MTDREHMDEPHDCGADAAAYALGALEPAEAEAFREHLAECAICRDEVSAFQAVVDVVPHSAPPQRVPRSLKRRVMAEVNADARATQPSAGSRPRRRLSLPRPALAALSLVLVAVVAVAAVAVFSSGSSTRIVRASVTWPGHAIVRVTGGRGELVVSGMPQPPSGKIYQVWVQRGSAAPSPTSVLFTVTASGAGTVDVPGNLNRVNTVMVTPEPRGGSPAPTHAPVLVAKLS